LLLKKFFFSSMYLTKATSLLSRSVSIGTHFLQKVNQHTHMTPLPSPSQWPIIKSELVQVVHALKKPWSAYSVGTVGASVGVVVEVVGFGVVGEMIGRGQVIGYGY
jgi:hypothetical protein